LLVPLDFAAASNLALDCAIDLARRYDSKIDVLHVLDEMRFAGAYAEGLVIEAPDLQDRQIDDAEQRLAEVRAKCAQAGVSASSQVLVGTPARVISEHATNRGTDLIVMGTHGRGGLAHLALGSVAERVLRTAPCPVLVVRDTARVADMLAGDAPTVQGSPLPA
jgi:nucleotide-binding universal stress UspA family protein